MIGDHVTGVATELEGFWKSQNVGTHPIKMDGSLNLSTIKQRRNVPGIEGEKASPIFASFPLLEEWLYREYPDRCNRTCGLHINVGVGSTVLSKMMNSQTHCAMIQSMLGYVATRRLGFASKDRLHRESFSSREFNPNRKYTAINWSKFNVYNRSYIEYRFFTAVMPPTKALHAIKYLVGLTNLVAKVVNENRVLSGDILKSIVDYRLV